MKIEYEHEGNLVPREDIKSGEAFICEGDLRVAAQLPDALLRGKAYKPSDMWAMNPMNGRVTYISATTLVLPVTTRLYVEKSQ